MAVKKAVLDIDLGGDKLKAALETLMKYKATAASLPAVLKRAGQAVVRATQGGARGFAAGASGMTVEERQANRERIASEKAAQRAQGHWFNVGSSIRRDVSLIRDTGVALKGYTGALLKWSGVASAVSGLAFGGSVFGLERLASAAYAGRRSATGLGISYGGQQSFGLAYQHLINSGAALGGASQARGVGNSEAAGSLYSLLGDPSNWGKDTGDTANRVLKRVYELARQTPEDELGYLQQNYSLGEHGYDVESLRRLKRTPEAEFGKQQADYEKREKTLQVQDDVLRRWQQLDIQLDATAQKLKTGLLIALEALAKPLGDVSDALGNFFLALAKSENVKWLIDKLAAGLAYLGDYLGKDEFKSDVKLFVDSIGQLAQKTIGALRLLGLIPDAAGSGAGITPPMLRDTPGHPLYKGPRAGVGYGSGTGVEGSPVLDYSREQQRRGIMQGIYDTMMAPFTGGKTPEMENYMKAIKMIESGSPQGDYSRVNKSSGAMGAYQVMPANLPGWSKQYLGHEVSRDEFLNNPSMQDEIFRKRWEEMLRKYGNPQDAASEWHSGVDLRTAVRQGRTDGNMTTGSYVNQFNKNLTGQGVSVNINNNTGGNATVTVAPLGLGAPNY